MAQMQSAHFTVTTILGGICSFFFFYLQSDFMILTLMLLKNNYLK